MPFATQTLGTWGEIRKHATHGWLYRGQRCASWNLETSLERYCDRQSVDGANRPEVERLITREFKRAYHDFGPHVPRESAHMEWLALMQHHGVPTRVLDFTCSVYVASYFALEKAKADSAVWAINARWAVQQSSTALANAGKDGADWLGQRWFSDLDEEMLEAVFISPPHVRMTCPLNPFLLNDRLRAQRGAFLVPGDITGSFVSNLEAMLGHDDPKNVYCLVLPASVRAEALRDLFHMNVTRATLFPGLDGYSQMLAVYHPTIVDPIQWK